MQDFEKILQFLNLAQNLKMELRHGWCSDGRQESVAEHSWRLGLMVVQLAPRLERRVDMLRCLKMALIHDLPEAIAGDLPLTLQTSENKKLHEEEERRAIEKMRDIVGGVFGEELVEVWREYHLQQTYESQFVKALDKLEAFIQHGEGPLEKWEAQEKEMLFQEKYLLKYCKFDSFLYELGQAVIQKCIENLEKEGEDMALLESEFRSKQLLVESQGV